MLLAVDDSVDNDPIPECLRANLARSFALRSTIWKKVEADVGAVVLAVVAVR